MANNTASLPAAAPAAAAAAAAAAIALANTTVSVTVGAKRKNEEKTEQSNKKAENYNFCCTNPWSGRCEPMNSIESQKIKTKDRADKCSLTLNDCQRRCQPPLLPDLLNLTLQYNPVVVKDAFDIKNDDPIMMRQGKVFGNMTSNDIKQQQQNSRDMDELLQQWTARDIDKDSITQIDESMMLTLKRIAEKLKQLNFAVNGPQMRRIINIYRDMQETYFEQKGGTQIFDKKYAELIQLLPKTLEVLYFVLEQFIESEITATTVVSTELSSFFETFPNDDFEVYDRFLERKERQLVMTLSWATNKKARRLSVVPVDSAGKEKFRLESWYFLWQNILSQFPKNFALALFYFAITHPEATVWHWTSMFETFLNRLNWTEGAALLRAWENGKEIQAYKKSATDVIDDKLYEPYKVTNLKMLQMNKKIRNDLEAGRPYVDEFPEQWIEYYLKVVKQRALENVETRLPFIEHAWLIKLLKQNNPNGSDVQHIRARHAELEKAYVFKREGGSAQSCRIVHQLF